MDFNTLLEVVKQKAGDAPVLGNKLKFDFGDGQILHIDGTEGSNAISTDDKEADCTINVSLENLVKIFKGELNPMTAAMMGKVKIKGDMSVAMKLKSLIG